MCGICGMVHLHGQPVPKEPALGRMNATLTHRGPDEEGVWHDGHVAFAMRRLRVIDLEGSHQPIQNESKTVTVVFNGEIYNFAELRRELQGLGHVFHSKGDTEVLVHAYEQYGEGMLERINGMFAFAVYDSTAGKLLLARDRLGIKPLFYTVQNHLLLFASELSALVASGLVSTDIGEAMDAYFEFLYIPAPDTIYTDVWKLRPGELLIAQGGGIRTRRYWTPSFTPDPSWTLDSAAERFRELIEDSVRLQSVSDVPLGAFLSGGVDSTTVVAALRQLQSGTIKTFTVGFDDPDAGELRYARIAANRLQTDHTEIVLTPEWLDLVPSVVRQFGEPFADSSALPTWLVSKVAREHVTVALSGDGGDELFAGYTWLHRSRQVAVMKRFPAPVRRAAAAAMGAMPSTPRTHQIVRALQQTFLSSEGVFRRRIACFPSDSRQRLLLGHETAVDRFAEHAAAAQELDLDSWMLHQDLVMYLPDDVLTKVDRMSMAHSLEVRVPLLDHRLVEFAGTLPFPLKMQGRISKRVMKHAMRKLIPQELLAQRKQGFAVPIHAWFRGKLNEQFQDLVLSHDARCAAWVDTEYARRLLREHVGRRENHGHRLWALLVLEIWLRGAR